MHHEQNSCYDEFCILHLYVSIAISALEKIRQGCLGQWAFDLIQIKSTVLFLEFQIFISLL